MKVAVPSWSMLVASAKAMVARSAMKVAVPSWSMLVASAKAMVGRRGRKCKKVFGGVRQHTYLTTVRQLIDSISFQTTRVHVRDFQGPPRHSSSREGAKFSMTVEQFTQCSLC